MSRTTPNARAVIMGLNVALSLALVACGAMGKGGSSSGNASSTSVSGSVALPFNATYKSDNKLTITVDGEDFLAEFSPWGAHAGGHTGHAEGDPKTNFSVYIQPADSLVEFKNHENNPKGDNDGLCENGETCGVTAAVALTKAPWFIAQHEDMTVTRYTPGSGAASATDYVAGETAESLLRIRVGELELYLYHLGEISSELATLLGGRTGDLSASPVSLSKGMKIARPQITYSFSADVDGQTIYLAHAQMEWTLRHVDLDAGIEACLFDHFSVVDQARLQKALEANLNTPRAHGRYLGYHNGAGIDTLVAAEGLLCTAATFRFDNYSTLSTAESYTWVGAPMGRREVLSLFPILTTSPIYQARKQDYTDPKSQFVFLRKMTGAGAFTLSDGSVSYSVRRMGGEVLDLQDATASAGSFVLKIISTDLNLIDLVGSNDPSGYFLGATYRLESDRLIVRWGKLASSNGRVILPDAVPATGVSCDGTIYSCYNHNRNAM